ncbi:MAG: regulatory iron-sulfur-containing complex subunit RicT [Gemmatimonadota bacterium]
MRLQEPVIVEAERGFDFGRVNATGDTAAKKCTSCATGCATGETEPPKILSVIRRASQDEIKVANDLRKSEEDVRRKVIAKVKEHNLEMKVSDAEWQWDRNKLTLYFTAEKRVDFRALVRDLASLFRTRIELRQIGVRDEAARLTGVGRCGREYCCSTWLTDLSPVNLSLAKDQHLSLNPQQISGGCGRLLCCLKYEHDFYVTSRRRFPKEGKILKTSLGTEKVVAVDIFRERVFLRHEEQGPRIISLVQLKEELEISGEPFLAPPEPRHRPAPEPVPLEPAPEGTPPATAEAGASPARPKRRRRGRRGRGGNTGSNPAPESPPIN